MTPINTKVILRMYDHIEDDCFEAHELCTFIKNTLEENMIFGVRATFDWENEDDSLIYIATDTIRQKDTKSTEFKIESAKALLKKLYCPPSTISFEEIKPENQLFYFFVVKIEGDIEDLLEDMKFFLSLYHYQDRHEKDSLVDFIEKQKSPKFNLDDEVLRTKDVTDLLKIGRTKLNDLKKEPSFPRTSSYPNTSGNFWLKSQILTWVYSNFNTEKVGVNALSHS
jgi:predicted DNA-binding transcriptional regulator AlpA